MILFDEAPVKVEAGPVILVYEEMANFEVDWRHCIYSTAYGWMTNSCEYWPS